MSRRNPKLTGLATALPPNILHQDAVRTRAKDIFQRGPAEMARLLQAFDNAGVARRHGCMPLDSAGQAMGWGQRNALYEHHATELLVKAAKRTLSDAGCAAEDIDAIVVVSTTGIATPSLDARLMNRLPFRSEVMRLPIFGLGCAGGVQGLGRAGSLAKAHPGSRVLLLTVELCTLTFRPDDNSKSNIIAAALFGDGAAGAILSTHPQDNGMPLIGWGEHTWPNTLDVMGWNVANDGLGVVFARAIPRLIRDRYAHALATFLDSHGFDRGHIQGYACHPGGAKVLEAFESVFGLSSGDLQAARDVLHNHGNMSAPTALFVLDRIRRQPPGGPTLATALGPGFTAAFALFGQTAAG